MHRCVTSTSGNTRARPELLVIPAACLAPERNRRGVGSVPTMSADAARPRPIRKDPRCCHHRDRGTQGCPVRTLPPPNAAGTLLRTRQPRRVQPRRQAHRSPRAGVKGADTVNHHPQTKMLYALKTNSDKIHFSRHCSDQRTTDNCERSTT